uniref:TetR transcriptional regulator n=1 Tax=uncultured soil bacterium TaxID=164851 RepID=E2D2K4_9BACT|nr:TetR transcriptional regulator [uncultured soil bacterium]
MLLGRIHGGLDERRRDELLERFELDPRNKARTYSTGNRRKVALIAALATNAELLVLDEPTAGLDPLMEAAFRGALWSTTRRTARSTSSEPGEGPWLIQGPSTKAGGRVPA